jgi:hypothetical protein
MLPAVNKALLVVAVVSCGPPGMYRPPPVEQAVPTASGPPPPLADDPSTQIEQLHTDLISRRTALKLPTPLPPPEDSCEPVCKIETPPAKPAECTPGPTCTDTCTQADAACDDATKICDIAKQMRTEAWAAARCHDASATCADARHACCSCP